MERWLAEFFEYLMTTWREATPTDYLHLILGVIVAGWFYTRYFPR